MRVYLYYMKLNTEHDFYNYAKNIKYTGVLKNERLIPGDEIIIGVKTLFYKRLKAVFEFEG